LMNVEPHCQQLTLGCADFIMICTMLSPIMLVRQCLSAFLIITMMDVFTRANFKQVLTTIGEPFRMEHSRPRPTFVGLPCSHCGRLFADRPAVRRHCTRIHDRQTLAGAQVRLLTCVNGCAWCRRTFTRPFGLKEHLRLRIERGECPRCTRVARTAWKMPNPLRCPRCAATLANLEAFVGTHSDLCTPRFLFL
jgi:hypothetical protein